MVWVCGGFGLDWLILGGEVVSVLYETKYMGKILERDLNFPRPI